MNKNIIAIIATKNRTAMFKDALESILKQSHTPDMVIVVSDSTEENYLVEVEYTRDHNVKLIKDNYTNNYAGSLNTAIDYIIKTKVINNEIYPNNTYIAFLDDDDKWESTYIEKCLGAIEYEEDFIISGLYYKTETKTFPLEIPNQLDETSFLASNPHIQGSNTFIKFSTLLKAGCFDENMVSTTDRDLFTRVMMLSPSYKIINEYLVYIDASDDRLRLSNSNFGKNKSLSQFYSKYHGLMSGEVKKSFFKRSEKFTNLTIDEIEKSFDQNINSFPFEYNRVSFDKRIVYASIVSDKHLGLRLLKEIDQQNYSNTKVIFILNIEEDFKLLEEAVLKTHVKDYVFITIEHLKEDMKDMFLQDYLRASTLSEGVIKDIAIARTILNHYTKLHTVNGDVIWILDDDMRFSYLIRKNNEIVEIKLDIVAISEKYNTNIDVVVGSYSNDAPLPTMSTLRTSLLDFVFTQKLNKKSLHDNTLFYQEDYYYDLTDTHHKHLETPFKSYAQNLDDVFSGKAFSRPLYVNKDETFIPKSRGGNTIIYNRDVLEIPNMSITFGSIVARRGDYFWLKQAQEAGFKVIGSSYATLHDRIEQSFDYDKETEKALKDLIGSSFIKAYNELTKESRSEFSRLFIKHYDYRLSRIIVSYYRIMGLLQILKTNEYNQFSQINLENLIRKANQFKEITMIESSYDSIISIANKYKSSRKIPILKLKAEENLGKKLDFLGNGNEAVIFHDHAYVYKVFFKRTNLDIIKNMGDIFKRSNQLEEIKVYEDSTIQYIKYPYYSSAQAYEGGYAKEIAELLNFLKNQNLLLTNIKRDNFLIVGNTIKFIDYGKNIELYNEEKFEMSIKRSYQMIRYDKLSLAEFKHMISMSYHGLDTYVNFGIENFRKLLNNRQKEDIHDDIIISLIKKYNPQTLLDYGAGKCKIANSVKTFTKVSVYDIDQSLLIDRADKSIEIISDIKTNKSHFDMIISNLVLCSVDLKVTETIISNIHSKLSEDGHAIISICNPFFTDVKHTELKTSGRLSSYSETCQFCKQTIFNKRLEYHRTFNQYENLFRRQGFEIQEVIQNDGVDINLLEPISENIYFLLKKINHEILYNCSLLIKCNPMDYQTIKRDITHIVQTLEHGMFFAERVVVVDGIEKNRNRKFDIDNLEVLKINLEQLKNSNLIDRVIYCDNSNDTDLYYKWFGKNSSNAYASNGQQLLTSIKGFETITTRYVFQTDVDIIFSNKDQAFLKMFHQFVSSNSITGSLSIYQNEDRGMTNGHRTEVRSSFMDLKRLKEKLPIPNPIMDEQLFLPWHRALDQVLRLEDSIRFYSKDVYFIHPKNDQKVDSRLVSIVQENIFNSNELNNEQLGQVNLKEGYQIWVQKTNSPLVVFVRGYNTPPSKLLRMMESVKKQTYKNYQVVFIDDNSNDVSSEFLKSISRYDPWAKKHLIAIFNSKRVDSLSNLDFAMSNIITDPNTIVINLDSDDAFIRDDALEIIKNYYEDGADLTVGNCLRYDKPLKKYEVKSFNHLWERDGDNVWLHPKTFRRYLYEYIQDNLLHDGRYIEVVTDYAIMLPMIEHAKNPIFIHETLYFFQPSIDNVNKQNQYSQQRKNEMMNILLQRAKEDHMKKIVSIIGDSHVKPGDKNYEIAVEIGKNLVDFGFKVQTGGLGGVMEAALKGAKMSKNYTKGSTIAILPSKDKNDANAYADIIIATGLDILRNAKVVDTHAVIAVGGGSGTLSEIAIAWQMFKLIVGITEVDGWSNELAGKKIDNRVRYPKIEHDIILPARSALEAVELVVKNIDKYTRIHKNIKWRK